MQREIKFRAWDKKYKIMYYDEFFITPDGQFYWNDTNKESGEMIIQQYAGLKDKKGKEVFEGDIVKIPLGIGEIIWENSEASFAWLHNKIYHQNIGHSYLIPKESEVIGNIYENPELSESTVDKVA